ncbi:SRPBCC family protein [Rhizomonospora bruguierae]|uniref:SRPBCC family protein n=1 Tax=Rhizomonospora bruguierae TaxID=1581705 RepID=UPI001BD05AC4|nr:SRPBCC family protein [Micromonospora sp. NBRC 107566]
MSSVVESVDVAVPVRTAYDQWTQFEEFPRFMEGVKRIEQTSDTMTHWEVELAGVKREFDAQITEQIPDERVAWTSTGGTKHNGMVTFQRLDDGHTRVTTRVEVDPEGIIERVGDKVGLLKVRVKGDLTRFKEFIEARGTETGAWRGEVNRPAP